MTNMSPLLCIEKPDLTADSRLELQRTVNRSQVPSHLLLQSLFVIRPPPSFFPSQEIENMHRVSIEL